MKIYTRNCKHCGVEFVSQRQNKMFCNKTCYYKHNNKRLNERYKEKRKEERENKKFPKYITESGKEIQLDFDPIKDWDKFLEIKEKNP